MDKRAEIATLFFEAVEQADMSALKSFYASDAKIWHNFDNKTQTPLENLQSLAKSMANLSSCAFKNVRLEVFDGGFIRQHDLTGFDKSGAKVEIPICVVCRLRDGLIERLDEYVDLTQAVRLREPAGL